MAQFSEAKIGDRVWSISFGWGKIEKVNISFRDENIGVKFEIDKNHGLWFYYNDGRYMKDDLNPTLFWDEVSIIAPERPKEECEACSWLEYQRVDLLVRKHTTLFDEIGKFLLNQHHVPTCPKGGE